MSSGYARTTVLIGAAAAGLATVTLLYLSVYAPWKRPQAAVPVVLAAEDISAATVVSPHMLRVATVPENQLLPNAATRAIDVIQRVTTTPMKAGEQFVTTSLVDKTTAFGLAGIIPPGNRAMTITVDAADAVSGFLQPGDHVDVLASLTQGSDSIARTILQDIVLLAVGANIRTVGREQPEGGKEPAGGAQETAPTATKITIAVTPSEAERLVAAQHRGKLMIGLRGMSDSSRVATSGASTNAIFGIREQPTGGMPAVGMPAVGMPAQPQAAAPRQKASAQVYRKPAPQKGALVSQAPALGTLPPFTPTLEPGAKTIRVIKGSEVKEVEVGH